MPALADPRVTLVELAEREPLLGHRAPTVRAAIDAAALALEAPGADPALRARLMLRLASVLMVEGELEGAEQALAAAGRHAPDARALRFLGGARACRIALRRGERAAAAQTLVQTAAALPELPEPGAADEPAWRAVTIEVILGIAEAAVEEDPPAADAFEPLAQLVAELEARAEYADVAFTGHQLLAAAAMSLGDPAAPHLRAVVALARAHGSPADEIEARIALAGVLVAAGDPVGLEEAARTVQIARDRALEAELPALHRAALLAQAGVLASHGKTAGALDRVLELARAAQAEGDVAGYVAAVGVMAELYARTGDHVSAFRTITEAHRALSEALGQSTAALFAGHLTRLRDRVGAARLDRIAADVARADGLAGQIAIEKS